LKLKRKAKTNGEAQSTQRDPKGTIEETQRDRRGKQEEMEENRSLTGKH
jgi:hypothetical protein